MSAPEARTPGGNRANADTKTDSTPIIGDSLNTDKAYRNLQAGFAIKGHELKRSDPADGPVTYFAQRWGMVRPLPTLEDVRRFLVQIGGAV